MSNIIEKKRLTGHVLKRETLILDLCKNKNVLHLGCADWPFTEELISKSGLLHGKLYLEAKNLAGVDLSKKGIEYLKKIGYENLYVGNVEQINTLGINEKFDVIVAGELLEHLSNPGMFLANIHILMNDCGVLIITVPNTFAIREQLRAIMGIERVHPGHVFYFSPLTLGHLCRRYNFRVKKYYYYLHKTRKLIFRLMSFLIKAVTPYVSDGLIVIIERDNKNDSAQYI